MKRGNLKEKEEGLITPSQGLTIKKNVFKAKIENQNLSPLCRMCKTKEEKVVGQVRECHKLAKIQYKQWHDNMAKFVHWSIMRKRCLVVKEK